MGLVCSTAHAAVAPFFLAKAVVHDVVDSLALRIMLCADGKAVPVVHALRMRYISINGRLDRNETNASKCRYLVCEAVTDLYNDSKGPVCSGLEIEMSGLCQVNECI